MKTGQVYHSLMVFLNPKRTSEDSGVAVCEERPLFLGPWNLSSNNISNKHSVTATRKRWAFRAVNVVKLNLHPRTSVRSFRRHHLSSLVRTKMYRSHDICWMFSDSWRHQAALSKGHIRMKLAVCLRNLNTQHPLSLRQLLWSSPR